MNCLLIGLLLTLNLPLRDTSIRATDWRAYFLADTINYEFDREITDDRFGNINISYKLRNDDVLSYGFALIGDATFGDLDDDSMEEAVIPFHVGGSAGVCSYALFKRSSKGVRQIFHGSGYKMGVRIENDTLNVYQPEYTGQDPNCCAQSMTKIGYRLLNDSLVMTDSLAYGDLNHAANPVHKFYSWIRTKTLEPAYRLLLSQNYKQHEPFNEWVAGYVNTVSTVAEVGQFNESDSTVPVLITAVDNVNGVSVTSRYEGTWKLVWGNLNDGWLLDEPKIRKVK